MLLQKLEVGQQLPVGWQRGEGAYFHATESGYVLLYSFNRPKEGEIEQMHQGKPFSISVTRKGKALWILSRCGSLSWTDAPFHPALSPDWDKIVEPDEGHGTALTLILADSVTQMIKSLRLIGLGHDFSVKLLDAIRELAAEPFNPISYDADIANTMRAYSTQQLLSWASFDWKTRGD